MKLTKISCPSCGGGIDIDIKGRDTIFCPYCGSQISIDNGNESKTHNININANINARFTNDAAVERERRIDRQNEREYNKQKHALMMLLLMLFVLMGMLLISTFKEDASEKEAIAEGKIQIGISSSDIEEDSPKYQGIVTLLETTGFTNITVIDMDDAGIFSNKPDTIGKMTVDGDTSFSSYDYYDPDAKIIISYH